MKTYVNAEIEIIDLAGVDVVTASNGGFNTEEELFV